MYQTTTTLWLLLASPALFAGEQPTDRVPEPPRRVCEFRGEEAGPGRHSEISYYISILPNRKCVDSYGDGYEWFTAAEALGGIGKAAVPPLVERLSTKDEYELKLALYALMLASQDPELKESLKGDYLQLKTVLEEEFNSENKKLALSWWKKHKGLFERK